jgi:hypothetical protein
MKTMCSKCKSPMKKGGCMKCSGTTHKKMSNGGTTSKTMVKAKKGGMVKSKKC